MTKRKAITAQMKIDALLSRALCFWCGCDFRPGDRIEWDHFFPLGAGGLHTADNIRPMHATPCHAEKTHGSGATTAGSDIGKIKKMRHILTGKMAVNRTPKPKKPKRQFPKGRKMQSRPFERRRSSK